MQKGNAMGDDLPIKSTSEGLVSRAKGMIMQPRAEWQQVATETTEPAKVLTGYVIPLVAIGAIASLIGMQIFGINAIIMTIKPSLTFSITTAVISFVMSLVGVFVLAFIANFLSPKFGGKDNFPAAFRWVAYAMTASWVGGIFGLVPAIAIIGILFSLYSLYVLYIGATPVMGVPQDKTLGYTVVTIIAAIVLYFVVAVVTTAITGAMGLAVGAAGANQLDATTLNLGELGQVTTDGETSTVDLGELGRVEIDGDTATVSVDGQEVEVNTAALEAQAAALAAQAEAAKAAAAAE